jgi:hypothetical protein
MGNLDDDGGIFRKNLHQEGGESNAKAHLVLTPDGFALWLNTTIFICQADKKRKFRPSKKPNLGFFARGLSH